jgi:hypothetical protein
MVVLRRQRIPFIRGNFITAAGAAVNAGNGNPETWRQLLFEGGALNLPNGSWVLIDSHGGSLLA